MGDVASLRLECWRPVLNLRRAACGSAGACTMNGCTFVASVTLACVPAGAVRCAVCHASSALWQERTQAVLKNER